MSDVTSTLRSQTTALNRILRLTVLSLIATMVIAWPRSADAFAIYTVGAEAGCTFHDIQSAVNAAAANPGDDYVWISNDQTYTNQEISVSDQDVIIEGGFTSCADFTIAPTDTTTLRGAGGGGPIFAINGTANVVLNNLLLTGAHRSSGAEGGAIFYGGSGSLTLSNTTIDENTATYGAGIDISPSGTTILTLGTNTSIILNTADDSGGGVRVEGDTHLIAVSDQTNIGFNVATSGYGGGIEVIGPAYADIGAPGYGFGSGGVINNNTAAYGGGIAVFANQTQSKDAVVRLFTTVAERPVTIEGNAATVAGGAVYAKPFYGQSSNSEAVFCAYDFRMDANGSPEGSAIYLDFDSAFSIGNLGAFASLNETITSDSYCAKHNEPIDFGAVTCAADAACNELSDNITQDAQGNATTGALIYVSSQANVGLSHINVRHNRAGHAIHGDGDSNDISFASVNVSVIADNSFSQEPFLLDDAHFGFSSCTIAHNAVSAQHEFNMGAASLLGLQDVIIGESGPQTLIQAGSGGGLTINNVLSNDITTLPLNATTIKGDPMFVDQINGDYHLSAYQQMGKVFASPAIDFAETIPSDDPTDLDDNAFGQDVPAVQNFQGARDLGAYEARPITDRIFGDTFGDRLSIVF